MGYPIDGDDDFLIKLLFRLFGKPFCYILEVLLLFEQNAGALFMSVSRLKVLFY